MRYLGLVRWLWFMSDRHGQLLLEPWIFVSTLDAHVTALVLEADSGPLSSVFHYNILRILYFNYFLVLKLYLLIEDMLQVGDGLRRVVWLAQTAEEFL